MDNIKYAQFRLYFDIENINNISETFDYYSVIPIIKSHLKSIPRIIHVSVFIDIDLVVITYIGKIPTPIPDLIIPYLHGYKIIISFEFLRELQN